MDKNKGFTDPKEDLVQSMKEFEAICNMPMNSLSKESKRQHPLSIALNDRYYHMSLNEFLTTTGKQNKNE